MKKLVLSLFTFCAAVTLSFAQERTVTGTVTSSEDGQPIPGATVKVKGIPGIGVSTGADGNFAIKVPEKGKILVISSISHSQKEVIITDNHLNVVLTTDLKALDEVVVTALGVTKQTKTLGYSQTTFKNSELNASAPVSMFGGLQGKVSGVGISNISGSPGGSTKIAIRGFSSITGNNSPLFVIDGIPITNSTLASNNRGYDFGNDANDIDPNSIESMDLLKGSAATALYGSRGANGVIIITTKKGTAGKLKTEFLSTTTLTDVASVFKPQDQFGQGWSSSFIESENGNWGPKYDGKLRPWGAVVDNSQLLKPFSFIKNNVRNALTTGIETNNNITLSGGTEKSTVYLSYGNVYSNGYLPGDNDSYKRNNFSLRGLTKQGIFVAEVSLNYVGKNSRFVEQGDDSFYEDILQIPQDIPIKDLRNYKNKFFNVDNYFTPFAANPYYSVYENGSQLKSNRVYGNANLSFKVTNWLTIQAQQGVDVTGAQNLIWHNKNAPSPGSYNDGGNVEGAKRIRVPGNVLEKSINNFEYDSKILAMFNADLNAHFDIDGLLGVNYNDRGYNTLGTSVEDLAIPGFYQINNSANKPVSGTEYSHQRQIAAYASATLGYNKYLYLTLAGRNDLSSTLPVANRSYFYPALSLSYIASQSFNLSNTPLSHLKFRASYGETGNDTYPYRISNTAERTKVKLDFGELLFPLFGVPGYTINNELKNANLKPERVKEYEFGTNIRFFNERLGIDIAYYNKLRENLIFPRSVEPATGYTKYVVNFGKVRNRGIELSLTGKPIKTSSIDWTLNYTFTKNKSMVLELPEGLEEYVIKEVYDAKFLVRKKQPLGLITAPARTYTPDGKVIVDEKGYPVYSEKNESYGSSAPDFMMGLNNQLRYKNFTLSFTFDWHKGGVFYSGTADLLYFVGAAKNTTYNDRRPFIVPNSVKRISDDLYVENTTPITEENINDFYYHTTNKADSYKQVILDRSFLKLRETTLSYALPKSFAAKIAAKKLSVSLFGRNLLTWLAKENTFIDPEVSNFGTGLSSEFGEFRTAPPVRFFGATLNVLF